MNTSVIGLPKIVSRDEFSHTTNYLTALGMKPRIEKYVEPFSEENIENFTWGIKEICKMEDQCAENFVFSISNFLSGSYLHLPYFPTNLDRFNFIKDLPEEVMYVLRRSVTKFSIQCAVFSNLDFFQYTAKNLNLIVKPAMETFLKNDVRTVQTDAGKIEEYTNNFREAIVRITENFTQAKFFY